MRDRRGPDGFAAVKAAVLLSSYVGARTKLKAAGSGKFRGACPLHEGSNASALSVDDNAGLWKCFAGCGGGSIVDFYLAAHPGAQVREALEALAAENGVKLPEREGGARDGVSEKRMRAALEAVRAWAHAELMEGEGAHARAAYDYLVERGVTAAQMREHLLGVVPPGAGALAALRSASGDEEALAAVGLATTSQASGRTYTFLAGRIIFPIADARDRLVAFAGRRFGDDQGGPKYINSPESALYSKREVLYGGQRVVAGCQVALVEGYLDVIAVCAGGAYVGVAACGTSVSTAHVASLGAAAGVTLALDGDEPGMKAMSKAAWMDNALGQRGRALVLPAGADPFDVAAGGDGALEEMLAEASSLVGVAVACAWDVRESEAGFDAYLASTVASLERTASRDEALRAGARVRGVATAAYERSLSNAAVRARTPGPALAGDAAHAALDPGMAALVRRGLQMGPAQRAAVVAVVDLGAREDLAAIEGYLPIAGAVDRAAFVRVFGGFDVAASAAGDAAVAALMPGEGAALEDCSVVLRSMAALLAHDAQAVIAASSTATPVRAGLLALRRAAVAAREVEEQEDVLAFLLEAALEIADALETTDALG